MKKLFLVFCLAFALGGGAGEVMGVRQQLTDYMVVTNDFFACTFFPHHMFPVWFKTPEGREFPEIVRFLDRVKIGDTSFWLYTDLWAEQQVLRNTADEFVIRCSGVYCHIHGDTVAPGELRAVYTYTIRRDSPTMKVVAEISRTDDAPIRLFFLEPAWSMKVDFDRILADGKEIVLEPGRIHPRIGVASYVKGGLAVSVNFNKSAPIATARYQMKEGFSTILTYCREMKGRKLRLTGFMTFRDESAAKPR